MRGYPTRLMIFASLRSLADPPHKGRVRIPASLSAILRAAVARGDRSVAKRSIRRVEVDLSPPRPRSVISIASSAAGDADRRRWRPCARA